MVVKFFTFAKRINSTKRPTSSSAKITLNNVKLKDITDINNPVLEISNAVISNPSSYNYFYIDDFKRYYNVNSWTYNKGIWLVSGSVDLLATFQTLVGDTFCSIERCSAHDDPNAGLIDTMYPISTIIKPMTIRRKAVYIDHSETEADEDAWTVARTPYDGGFFVVGIMNGNAVTGACQYYLLTPKAYYATVSYLLRLSPYSLFDSVSIKANPLQYINSCKWVPITAAMVQAQGFEPVDSIYLYTTNILENNIVAPLNPEVYGQSYIAVDDADVPDHGVYLYFETELPPIKRETTETETYNWNTNESDPDASIALMNSYLDDPLWLRVAYTRHTLTAPYLGTVDLSSDIVARYIDKNCQGLYLRYRIDVQTGSAVVVLSTVKYGEGYKSEATINRFYDGMVQTWSIPFGTDSIFGMRENNTFDMLLTAIAGMQSGQSLSVASMAKMSSGTNTGSLQLTPYEEPNPGALVPYKERINLDSEGVTVQGGGSKILRNPVKPGIASRAAMYETSSAVRGTNGSYVDNTDTITITIYRADIPTPEDRNAFGYPVSFAGQIRGFKAETGDNYHPGFIKCRSAVIVPNYYESYSDAIATASDIETLQAIMLEGFYYEEGEET